MINIDAQGNISMSRGDIVDIPLTIKDGDKYNWEKYILSEEDYVEMYIYRLWEKDSQYVRKITITHEAVNKDGDIIVTLKPEDTQDLEEEKYYFVMKIFRESEGNRPETLFTKRWIQFLT